MQWYNIWINGSSPRRKVLKLSNIGSTDWTNMTYSLLTGCLTALTNLFTLLVFSSGSFSIGSLSKSKLDRKYNSKESHCINVLSKRFSVFNHLVEIWLITFLTLLLPKLMNSLRWFLILHSCDSYSLCQQQNLHHLKKVLWLSFQKRKVINDKDNQE